MTDPVDLRDESCTNLAIRIALIMKSMKSGDDRAILVTRKQSAGMAGIPERSGVRVVTEPSGNDILLLLHRPGSGP